MKTKREGDVHARRAIYLRGSSGAAYMGVEPPLDSCGPPIGDPQHTMLLEGELVPGTLSKKPSSSSSFETAAPQTPPLMFKKITVSTTNPLFSELLKYE